MHKPPALRRGDSIALLAPADSPREPSEVPQAKDWLERSGFRVFVGAHVFSEHGYLAGTDAERLADFHAAWADESIRAILCVRGKWGASRLVPQLDFDLIARNPKMFIGCGDVTALLVAIWQCTGLVTFHGPTAARLGSSSETRKSLLDTLAGKMASSIRRGQPAESSPDSTSWDEAYPRLRSGTAMGTLVGGSISALIGLLATPFAFDPKGTLLFLEETDQRFSQFDRDLTTLRLAGITSNVNGLIIGECAGASSRESPQTLSLEEIFAEQVERLTAPALVGLPIGQGRIQYTLPIGIPARVDAGEGTLELLERAVD